MSTKHNLLWILGIYLTLLGCEVAGQPEVDLKEAKLAKADLEKVSFELVFGLHNPFPVEVSFTSIQLIVELSGREFFMGQAEQMQTLKARTNSDFTLPFEIRYSDALFSLIDLITEREIPYRMSGSFTFNTPIGNMNVDFEQKGTFDNPF